MGVRPFGARDRDQETSERQRLAFPDLPHAERTIFHSKCSDGTCGMLALVSHGKKSAVLGTFD